MLLYRIWTQRRKSKEELEEINEQWREASVVLNQGVCGVFVGAVWQRTATVLIEAVAAPNPNVELPLVIINAILITYVVGKVFVTLSWIYISSDDGGDDTVKWNAFLTFCRKCATESFGFAVKDLVVNIIFDITLSSTSSLGSAFGVWLLVVIVFSMVIIGTSFIQVEAFGLVNLNEKLLEFESDGFALPLAFTFYAIVVVGMNISPPYVTEEIGTEIGSDFSTWWWSTILFLFLSVICPTSLLLLEERSKAVKRKQQKQAYSNAQSLGSVHQASPMHQNSPSASSGKGVPSPPILPPHPPGIASSSLPLSAPAPSQHHIDDDDDEEEKDDEPPLKASMDALMDLFVTAQAYFLAVSWLACVLPSDTGNMLANIISLFILLAVLEYGTPYTMKRFEDKAHAHLEAHLKAKAELHATAEMSNSVTQSSPADNPSTTAISADVAISTKVWYYIKRAYRKIMHRRSMFIVSTIRLVVGFGFEEFLAAVFIAISSTFPPEDDEWANLVFLCSLSVIAFIVCAFLFVKLTLMAKKKGDAGEHSTIAKTTSGSVAFGTLPTSSVDTTNGTI